METSGKVRVDAWLWAVRLFKTRSQAAEACKGGHVRVGGDRAKPATTVAVGDRVTVRGQGRERIVEVRELLVKRVGAPLAAEAFVDHSPPPPPRPDGNPGLGAIGGFGTGIRDRGAGRPTKQERRQLDRLRGRGPR
ncbi:MAG: RNA-binding S4 domain-containing protein [Bifidobacteriaceae bacterium]|nr:RNA-binding S4 domain-containing protein [Bifidobacteriaceae bacterium]